jgi:hypothetical protein
MRILLLTDTVHIVVVQFAFSPRLTKKERLDCDIDAELELMSKHELPFPNFVSPFAKEIISAVRAGNQSISLSTSHAVQFTLHV